MAYRRRVVSFRNQHRLYERGSIALHATFKNRNCSKRDSGVRLTQFLGIHTRDNGTKSDLLYAYRRIWCEFLRANKYWVLSPKISLKLLQLRNFFNKWHRNSPEKSEFASLPRASRYAWVLPDINTSCAKGQFDERKEKTSQKGIHGDRFHQRGRSGGCRPAERVCQTL